MHVQRNQPLALALLALCALVAAMMAGVIVLGMGMHLTPLSALGALGLSALLVGAAYFVHDAMRAARWNAGHRLR